MNKHIPVITLLIAFTFFASFGQSDSLWLGSVSLRHASASIASTGSPFKVTSAEVQLRKLKHTLVANMNYKTIHSINGYQFGSAYYQKWNWGYGHIGCTYSKSLIYPSLSLSSSLFINLVRGLEINIGFSGIEYADGNRLKVVTTGATYYYRSSMAMYQFRKPIAGYENHRLMVRKYLNTPKDYIELSLARGLDVDGTDPSIGMPISISSVQVSLLKKIFHKTQIQVSFGLTKAINTDSKNIFNYGIGLKRDI